MATTTSLTTGACQQQQQDFQQQQQQVSSKDTTDAELMVSVVSEIQEIMDDPCSSFSSFHSAISATLSDSEEYDENKDHGDCSSAVLDTMDNCVVCVEGVEIQRAFEEDLELPQNHPLMMELSMEDGDSDASNADLCCNNGDTDRVVHTLSPSEAALIRLTLMEEQEQQQPQQIGGEQQPEHPQTTTTTTETTTPPRSRPDANMIPDFDDMLNICGSDEDFSLPQVLAYPCPFFIPCPKLEAVNTTMDDTTNDTSAQTNEDSFASFSRSHDGGGDDEGEDDGEALLQCAVCLDEALTHSKRKINFANLPCCGGAVVGAGAGFVGTMHIHDGNQKVSSSSPARVCTTCIYALSTPTSDGSTRVGRCPCCRAWLVISTTSRTATTTATATTPSSNDHNIDNPEKEGGQIMMELDINLVSVAGKCQVCWQIKELLVEESSICDACFVGRRQPLLYDCENCQTKQRIPHPMYRYQRHFNDFSDSSMQWKCQGCGKFSHWRLGLDQIPMILPGDAPDSWQEDSLETARQHLQVARGCSVLAGQHNNKLTTTTTSDAAECAASSSCILL